MQANQQMIMETNNGNDATNYLNLENDTKQIANTLPIIIEPKSQAGVDIIDLSDEPTDLGTTEFFDAKQTLRKQKVICKLAPGNLFLVQIVSEV